MMTALTLINEMRKVIENPHILSYSSASDANDVFEGYALAVIIKAARAAKADVHFEDNDERPAYNLIFRTSPGDIFSRKKKYTHAVILIKECPPLEAHIGVKVTGRSGVLHECDVAVIDRNEARICRTDGVHPRSSKVLIAAECKFYAGSLKLESARGYLGLAEELSKQNRMLVTNTSSASAAKMVAYHKAGWEFDLSSPVAAQANDLEAKFKESFRNYTAKRKI